MGGYGAPSILELAQMQKWAILNSAITVGGHTQVAALAMVDRTIHNPLPLTLFLSSLLKWTHSFGLSLHVKNEEEWEPPDFSAIRTALKLDDPDLIRRFPISNIVTDGSFTSKKLKPSDVATPVAQLRDSGTGGIGIVWMGSPTDEKWKLQTPRILNITTNDQLGLNAFTLELLAQILAYHISYGVLSDDIPTHSDCEAALFRLTSAKNSLHVPMGHAKYGLFLESLVAMAHLTFRPSGWLRSHPEDRKANSSQYSYGDHGIFLADAAAEGDWNAVKTHMGKQPFIHHTMAIDELLEMLIAPGVPHWRTSANVPVTDDILLLAQQLRVDDYLETRDAYRAKDLRPPKWKGTNTTFPMLLTPIPAKSSFRFRSNAITRI